MRPYKCSKDDGGSAKDFREFPTWFGCSAKGLAVFSTWFGSSAKGFRVLNKLRFSSPK